MASNNESTREDEAHPNMEKYSKRVMLKNNGSLDTVTGKMSGYNGQYFTIFRKNGLLYVMTSRSGETFNTERGIMVAKLSRGRLIQLATALGEDIDGDDDLSELFRQYKNLRGVDTDMLRAAIISRCENHSEIQAGSFIQRKIEE